MRRIVLLLTSMALAMLIAVGLASVVWEEQAKAAFPGTNGKIVFDRSGRDGGIYAISFRGRNLKRLAANTRSVWNIDPAWSANGKKIVFVKQRTGSFDPDRRNDLYIMNADGSNKKLVTDEDSLPGPRRLDDYPAFSPSGKIVFVRSRDIYTINPDGSRLTNLTNDAKRERSPAWSPDGRRIAFDTNAGVNVMKSDGSSPVRIADNEFTPVWSPDGTKIAYPAGLDGVGVMNADGSEKTVLHRGCRRPFVATYYGTVAFSPGGGKMVFSKACRSSGNDYDLYIIDSDGSGVRQLTNYPGHERNPDWQPVR